MNTNTHPAFSTKKNKHFSKFLYIQLSAFYLIMWYSYVVLLCHIKSFALIRWHLLLYACPVCMNSAVYITVSMWGVVVCWWVGWTPVVSGKTFFPHGTPALTRVWLQATECWGRDLQWSKYATQGRVAIPQRTGTNELKTWPAPY